MAETHTTQHAESHVDPLMGIILPYVNFAIFFVLLIYFAKKPVLAAAKKRQDDFQQLMAQATKAKQAAESKLAELNAKYAQLDKEIEEIRTTFQTVAEAEAAKVVADAEALAANMKLEARRIADAELARARQGLREEIVAAVKANVTNKIQTEMTVDAQLALVQRQIKELHTVKTEG